jgi:hypothetical protein
MRLFSVSLAAIALLLTACPEDKPLKELDDKRKEAVDKVGGAAKRQIDQVHEKTEENLVKGMDKINKAVDEATKDDDGGW